MLSYLNHASLILLIIMGNCHQTINLSVIVLIDDLIFLYYLIVLLFCIRWTIFNGLFLIQLILKSFMGCISQPRIISLALTFTYLFLFWGLDDLSGRL